MTDQEMAKAIKAAAAKVGPAGRFGDNKVYLCEVAKVMGMEFGAFAAVVTKLNNRMLVELSRADLVQAMDPAMVAASEARWLNATYHFIRLA